MATLRELLTRDQELIKGWVAMGGRYPYYHAELPYYMDWETEETRALAATAEYQEIILGIVQKYGCVAGTCAPKTDGAYTESTCGGACKQVTPNSSWVMIIIVIVGLALAFAERRK